MKFYLISDNLDTLVGLRLVGIEGTVIHDAAKVEEELGRIAKMPDIAVILLTAPLASSCRSLIEDWRLHRISPLIVSIPDRHGTDDGNDILQYVQDAIGIKV